VRLFFSPDYVVDTGGSAFQTGKFALTVERLLEEGVVRAEDVADPVPAAEADLVLAHAPEWVEKVLRTGLSAAEEALLELPWSPALALAHVKCAGGTLGAAREALGTGLGLHAGGGSHHAFPDHGEGFCVFNDLAVALLVLRREDPAFRAAVVDLDAHQGNGTAAILAGRDGLSTFSMHQEDLYPFGAQIPWSAGPRAGTLDVGVPAGTSDAKYLKLLAERLPRFLEGCPALVLYQAGVDPWEGDRLGGLKLTEEGLAQRDRMVFETCFQKGVPVAVTLGGGYADSAATTARLHARTLREAADCHRRSWHPHG